MCFFILFLECGVWHFDPPAPLVYLLVTFFILRMDMGILHVSIKEREEGLPYSWYYNERIRSTQARRCCRSCRGKTFCLETKAPRALSCNQNVPRKAWRVRSTGERVPSLDVHDSYGVIVVEKGYETGDEKSKLTT